MIEYLTFLSKFILTNAVFGLALCALLIRIDRNRAHPPAEIVIASFGLAPPIITLLLYYSLLVLPSLPDLVYFVIVLSFFVGVLYLGRHWMADSLAYLKSALIKGWQRLAAGPSHGFARWLSIHLASLLVLYLAFLIISSLQVPIGGHDALSYAAQGKALYKIKHIELRGILLDPATGIYRPSFHAPSFPLFLTWEMILNGLFGFGGDMYFRSVHLYFGILIIALLVYWLNKKGRALALLGVIGLLSSRGFFLALARVHIDTYRIFFLLLSWIYLARALRNKDRLSLVLLGASSGIAAFAHTLGAFAAALTLLVFFLFLGGRILYRFQTAALVCLWALAAGGLHYLIDMAWGSGWILSLL